MAAAIMPAPTEEHVSSIASDISTVLFTAFSIIVTSVFLGRLNVDALTHTSTKNTVTTATQDIIPCAVSSHVGLSPRCLGNYLIYFIILLRFCQDIQTPNSLFACA